MSNRVDIDFSYYKPINSKQEEFHASRARHKLLIGGYGAGKSYPAIHESIFHILDQPAGNNFLVCRNTWDTLEAQIENDFVEICRLAGVVREWFRSDHDLLLLNGNRVMFRPLTLNRENFKSMHLCGMLLDDPDVHKFQDVITSLWGRFRAAPRVVTNRYQSIITANWEGRNWLWQTYMKDKPEGGDEDFAYWVCPTTANPTLPESYIKDMEAIHSKEWMDRYVHCKFDNYVGLVYPEVDRGIHHMPKEEMLQSNLVYCAAAVDVGLTHATVVLSGGTDGENIFIWDEWYQKGTKPSELGEYLVREVKQSKEVQYSRIWIDPASGRKDMTSGVSVREQLRRIYGIMCESAENDVAGGIQKCRDLMMPASKKPRLFFDFGRLPNTMREMEFYRWEDPRGAEFDEVGYNPKPVKKKDDAMDTMRYLVAGLSRRLLRDGDAAERSANFGDRVNRLRMYKEYPQYAARRQLVYNLRKDNMSPVTARRVAEAGRR